MAANFGKIQAWGWDDGDDQWGSDVNNNFATVDRLVANPAKGVASDPTVLPPPSNNDIYIVGESPVFDFANQEGRIAYWSSVTYGGDDSWKFMTAALGQSVSMADGSVRTYSDVGGIKYWVQTNAITVNTWPEFKNAMQSETFGAIQVGVEIYAAVDDLFTVYGHKRVIGEAIHIENTTLTMNTGTVNFFCDVYVGNNAGSAGEITGSSPTLNFRKLHANTESTYSGSGDLYYEKLFGVVTNTSQLFWDNTNTLGTNATIDPYTTSLISGVLTGCEVTINTSDNTKFDVASWNRCDYRLVRPSFANCYEHSF